MIKAALLEAMQHVNGLLQAGDFREAHARLATIAKENPHYAEAQRLLGGVTLALGDAAGAERILRRAIERAPHWTPTLVTLGELLLGSGRQVEAEALLRKAVIGDPPSAQAALVLARLYNDRRQFAQALAVVAPFCTAENAPSELAVQHATALVGLGRAEDAVSRYRDISTRVPGSAPAAEALAVALQATGHHADAEAVAAQAVGRGPKTPALCYTHARSLIALGAWDRAEAALRDCLRLQPQHIEAHGDLAKLIWMRTGDRAAATAAFDEALRTFSNNDALWAAKAAVLQGAGDPRAAFACLAPRIERAHAPPALLVRAGLAALEFDPRRALELAGRALRAAPSDTPARTLKVAAMLGVGDARGALPDCEALRATSPDDQYLIALQTTAWRMLGDERYAQLCDYRKWVVPYRLETPPGWTRLAGFLADVQRSLDRLHDALAHPLLFQSLRHGTETTNDLTRSEDPVIRALFAAFHAPIRDYIARLGQGDDPLRRRNTGAYRFNGSWSVRLRTSGFHHNHVHPRGWISSACYIALPGRMNDAVNREGVLTFAEPGILTTPALPSQHDVRPEAGTLVLFPSYFWHGTVPFSGEQPRLTVAFDAVPSPEM
ncbi:MAG TPA: tetratricopeptide repeat protein [Rhodanobacteraceae bacterium]|nr:tetratricopeptide repeat protein [Rhodanobacteraceae bacterium]